MQLLSSIFFITYERIDHINPISYTIPLAHGSSVSESSSESSSGSIMHNEDTVMEEANHGRKLKLPPKRLKLKTCQLIGPLYCTQCFQHTLSSTRTTMSSSESL